MSTPALEFRSIMKSYRDFMLRLRAPALRDFSLSIEAGEIVGLLGPNGSGKSTAINLAVGLLKPTKGEVLLFGKNPRDSKARKALGYLPEENANIPSLSARQLVETHGKLAGLSRKDAQKRAQELLERVGLADALDRKSQTYSKGMARRLGLAQCLVGSPTMLILDEPTSGLDPVATELVRELLLELKSQGISVLLSSHLLAEIEDICDRLVVLKSGKTVQIGAANELLSLPDQSEVRLSTLSEANQQSLREWAKTHGVVVKSIRTPNKSLSQFYREIVEAAEGEKA